MTARALKPMTAATTTAATVNCYRLQCGLPVSGYDSDTVVMTTGQTVDAIGMPVELGRRVWQSLRIAMLAGPILLDEDEPSWIFLCTLVEYTRPELYARLPDVGVRVYTGGALVTLPPDAHGRDPGWIQPPLPRCTPAPWQAILATVRRLTETS